MLSDVNMQFVCSDRPEPGRPVMIIVTVLDHRESDQSRPELFAVMHRGAVRGVRGDRSSSGAVGYCAEEVSTRTTAPYMTRNATYQNECL